jgi:hypothetical protein
MEVPRLPSTTTDNSMRFGLAGEFFPPLRHCLRGLMDSTRRIFARLRRDASGQG